VIGFDRKPLARLDDRNLGGAGQEIGQPALVAGTEVLHEHEGHPGVRRQMDEELGEGLEAPGGSADPDDGKRAFPPWLVSGQGLGLINGALSRGSPRVSGGIGVPC
jgi:hypothetical protein